MLFGTSSHLVVLHDAGEAQKALVAAIATAPPEQIPGLQRAIDILSTVSGSDALLEQRWAEQVLKKKGFDPVTQDVEAIRALRQELPGLALTKANELVQRLKATATR
jgi:muramidase (phage lysozyme)